MMLPFASMCAAAEGGERILELRDGGGVVVGGASGDVYKAALDADTPERRNPNLISLGTHSKC